MLKVAIAGASGRMGRVLIDAVTAAPDLQLAATLSRDGNAVFDGSEIAEPDLARAIAACNVLIDFTRPEATLRHLAACVERRVPLVIGTTGLDEAARATIGAAAKHIGVVLSPNMSIGVNVVFRLVAEASRALATGYDVEIVEAHHRNKVDAPSGTAVRMGEIVAAARGLRLDDVALHGRAGRTGVRDAQTIGFSAIRGGDIVGDHTVLFAGSGERIELTHKASSRDGYAAGSLIAARFVAEREHGLFDMQDVLGLR